MRRRIAEVVLDAGVQRDGVGALGQLLAVDSDSEAPPELVADVIAQRRAPLLAGYGNLFGRGPGGIQKLHEEDAARCPLALHRELP